MKVKEAAVLISSGLLISSALAPINMFMSQAASARQFQRLIAEKTEKGKKDKSEKSEDAKGDKDKDKGKDKDKVDKDKDKDKDKAQAPKPEPVIDNVVSVTTDQLVEKPAEYLNKNVKFQAPFYAFSNLALDYKPAYRPQKEYLSFLILRNGGHIPYSEIKLAMPMPKDPDPNSKLLQNLKDGDTIEIIGKVFATALDEPWIDVLRLKKIASAPDDKKDDKTAKADDKKDDKSDTPSASSEKN